MVLAAVGALLQREGRITYWALKRTFGFDDAFLEGLREELVLAKQVASDEDGKVLVWRDGAQLAVQSDAEPPQHFTAFGTSVVSSSAPAVLPPLVTRTDTPKDPPGLTHPNGPDASVPAVATPVLEAERRQLTVMFCDRVGSTALSGQLDPEDLREVVRAYQETAAEAIARFEGHIAQYLGDGLLVYFGYPRAHEDDAQRAVYTGLKIIDAMGTLNESLESDKGIRLAVRLGIHTGLVVVGEMGGGDRHEQLALGETPNIAARLEGLADPDTIVISAATAQLVQNTFALEEEEIHSLKGVAEPMSVSRVIGPIEEQQVEDETTPESIVFLVGRDEEVGLLRRRWEQAKEGLGQVVLLNGEAGIGKTTLVDTLRATVHNEGCTRITLRCSPYHQNSALYPIIEHLQSLLNWQQETSSTARLNNLEQHVRSVSLPTEETVPLFAEMLSLPVLDGQYPALNLDPQQRKQRTQDALVGWLPNEAERQPLLVMWEDLHWADPSTLEILALVIDQTPTVQMINVLTYRPEFIPPWPMRSHMTPLTLNRLERLQVEALILHLAAGKLLPPDVIQHVVEKTDGVPLFVEELTKMVLESDLLRHDNGQYELVGPLSELSIPSTLHDSLMARLDRLPEVREVAQLGAVLGREFTFEVLRAVTTIEDSVLQDRLAQLVETELLYQRGRPPRATYIFKHALIQDTAYASLLRSTRQHYHQQIAQIFEQQFPEIVETQPEVVAHHYTEGGEVEKAVAAWQKAGQQAAQQSANTEAVRHLTMALDLLQKLPETSDHLQLELQIQLDLTGPLISTSGYLAAEVGHAYTRARTLCQQVGDKHQLATILFGLHRFYALRVELQTAREMAEEGLKLAQGNQDPLLLLPAHTSLGAAVLWQGEYQLAREHFEQAVAIYDPDLHGSLAILYGEDLRVNIGCFGAWALWYLGYPDQARWQSQTALAIAQESAHPLSLAHALNWTAWLHQLFREDEICQEQAAEVIAVADEHGLTYDSAMGIILRGWARASLGYGEEGVQQIKQGLTTFRTTQIELHQPYFLALLVEAYGQVGQPEEGLIVLAEAIERVDRTRHRMHEAELYRLTGVLMLQQAQIKSLGSNMDKEAEENFQHAIALAQRQNAKSLELRAAMDLARLWQQQSKTAEAHQMLAEVYNWFTEGFDTKDLQEAKILLRELE